MQLRIDPYKPDPYRIEQVVDCLRKDGLIVYPTDTVYTLGCRIQSPDAMKRLCELKGVAPKQANFSIVCSDLSHLSDFAFDINSFRFKILKHNLPGPFTFILPASKSVSKIYGYAKKTIGFRIPDHAIPRAIVKALGEPIFSASIKNEDQILEYITDPDEVYLQLNNKVDLVVDGGYCGNIASGIYDISSSEIICLREGEYELR